MDKNVKSLNVEHSNNSNKFRKMKTKSKNKKSLIKSPNSMNTKTSNASKTRKSKVVNRIEDIYWKGRFFERTYQASGFYEALSWLYPLDVERLDNVFQSYKIIATDRYSTTFIEEEVIGTVIPCIDRNGKVREIMEMANHPEDGSIVRRGEPIYVSDNDSKSPYIDIYGDKIYYSGREHIEGYSPDNIPFFIGEHLAYKNKRNRRKPIIITQNILLAVLLSCMDASRIYLAWQYHSVDEEHYTDYPFDVFSDSQLKQIKNRFKGRDVKILRGVDLPGIDSNLYKYVFDELKAKVPIEDILEIVHKHAA